MNVLDIFSKLYSCTLRIRKTDFYFFFQDYNNVTYENDVALVELEESVKFTCSVRPICLPFKFKEKDFDEEVSRQMFSLVGRSHFLCPKVSAVFLMRRLS